LLESTKVLICEHNIRNIYFVLSEQNKIVVDAMEGQNFPQIRGLQNLINEINLNKRQSELFWKTSDSVHPVLSYYLNRKIIQLQANLGCVITQQLTLKGKIYIKSQNKFIDIYTDLVCLKKYSLN
jgi:hypothetical protein